MTSWLAAFALTSVIEVPIHARALARHHRLGPALLLGFCASALTHPFVYFVFPRLLQADGLAYLLVAETFAVGVEAAWLRRLGVREALLWSLVANATSVALATAWRAMSGS